MIVAFAAIILALSNGITLLISTISLSTFKAIRACGIECKMSDNDSCSDTEEDDNDVLTDLPERPTIIKTYHKSPLWSIPTVD
tara:strand:+ start:1792 stop:2040 length:249 start_codon:yes stop_codon:yes gene_type:complete